MRQLQKALMRNGRKRKKTGGRGRGVCARACAHLRANLVALPRRPCPWGVYQARDRKGGEEDLSRGRWTSWAWS